jgi:hypothetical protein
MHEMLELVGGFWVFLLAVMILVVISLFGLVAGALWLFG